MPPTFASPLRGLEFWDTVWVTVALGIAGYSGTTWFDFLNALKTEPSTVIPGNNGTNLFLLFVG